MSISSSFMTKLAEFAEGKITSGELTAAAGHEDEHVLAACAVSSHHLKESNDFPKAANCLVNTLRLVHSPINIAQLRLQQAIAYHGHKHPGIAIDLIDQGLDVLGDANDDETTQSLRKELVGLRQELECAA